MLIFRVQPILPISVYIWNRDTDTSELNKEHFVIQIREAAAKVPRTC